MKKYFLATLLTIAMLATIPFGAFAKEVSAEEFAQQTIEAQLSTLGYSDIEFSVSEQSLYSSDESISYFTDVTYSDDGTSVESDALIMFAPESESYTTQLLVIGTKIYVNQLSANESVDEPVATPAPFETLSNGSKGDNVIAVQERLKELGYLSGKADGSYGNKTASAVNAFQAEADLKTTGKVDKETYDALMSADAPSNPTPVIDASSYEKLDYKAIARNPDSYDGTMIKFDGKVLQVMESDLYNVYRIASKGNYDNVVYVKYILPKGSPRILEDDKVTVYGKCTGVYTYETVRGDEITIPSCWAERIELR